MPPRRRSAILGTARVRFDDRLATAMTAPAGDERARSARWRQLVDLLAQRKPGEAHDSALRAYAALREARTGIPLAKRCEVAASLSGRAVAPDLLIFLADDHPSVAAPLLAGARLTGRQWLDVLPSLSPTGRALLRHRRDLDAEVEQALAGFGASDFAISGTVGAAPVEGEMQIRELVARIEAFRKHRDEAPPRALAAAEDEDEPLDLFRWETGPDGVILWVEDAPRGPLVGQSIASIAGRGQQGVDGQAAGAFEKRAPFRDARFSVAGSGAAAGDWRISGVPFFDPHSGSFIGYRGSARRPRLDEVARAEAAPPLSDGLFGTNLPADSLRQLIHELRTPLNAIVGFAEMIDGQYLGPAGASYRGRASDIMAQAGRLLSAVDDLDTAARIETSRLDIGDAQVDAVALICRLHDSYERIAAQRGAKIAIAITRDLPPARVDAGAAERMFARMLAATIGLAQDGETIDSRLSLASHGGGKSLCLTIDRPRAIAGLEEAALLDPGYSPEGDWPGAPALGLGFALRLVRNLAESVGGALTIAPNSFALHLPAAESAALSTG